MASYRTRRALAAVAAVLLLLTMSAGALWYRCGLHGCPDVDMLRGYMPNEASVMLDRNGDEISKLLVERHQVVRLDSLPEHVPNAFVAIEDRRFWEHGGVDWRRVVGALISNVKAGEIEEGSSTITMQLARNVFPEKLPAHKRTIWRKIGEARVAREIESRYGKREILELYVNQIYFGNGAYGIESASREYFGKPASGLDLSEAALLAALPRAPSRLNPRANEVAAREGRDLVLRRMVAEGFIDEQQRAAATKSDIELRQSRLRVIGGAPYFVEVVRRQLEQQLGTALYTEGYTIHTTLDLGVQRLAEAELGRQLDAIESGRYGTYVHMTRASVHADTANRARGTPYLQGAFVIMDASTGDVLTLIGGRDFAESEFNRATSAERQPGSAFKPFVYAAALSAGFPPTHQVLDEPLRLVMDNGRVWEPENYEGSYAGVVTMRDALTYSKNVATIRLANEVGLSRVIGMAEQFGLGPLSMNPAVVLGTAEVTPLQLASAYAAFATLGQRPEPRFVSRVVDRNGLVVWSQQPETRTVIDPATAFLTVSMLQDVVNRGTATAVRAVGFRGAAAGKTGTTQDAADAWFVGFTPHLVGAVWIGLDQRKRIVRGATGGELAAPVWGRVMARAGLGGGGGWTPPAGVEQRVVDASGTVVADNCPPMGATRNEYFLRGTAPIATCYPTGYAWGDTLPWGYGYDDQRPDSIDDLRWWQRLRRRLFGPDSAAMLSGQDTLGPPVGAPPETIPPLRPIPSDSLRRLPFDTVRRLPGDTLRRLPGDTLRRPGAIPDSIVRQPRRVIPLGTPVRARRDTLPSPRPKPDTLSRIRT